jgi:hypothetical protein
MCSNNLLCSFVIAFVISITISNCDPGANNIFPTPPQCANKENQGKDKCMKEFCAANQNKFVCKSLKCKLNYQGNGIADNMGKLECIKNTCKSHPSKLACRKLKQCEAKKNDPLVGLFSYIGCVIKLFS